jgi:Cof subfamily protein (haloacid dehalogenase superfamily)
MPEGRHAEDVPLPAGERSEGARRLPDEAAGLKLPADFPRSVEAIACDLDRTLIGEDVTLHPRTRDAIAATRTAGIHVILVTGRMFQSVRRYARDAGIDDPVVCYQGAVVAEPMSGRWLRHEPIPLELGRETIAALNEEGFGLNCYVNDELYVAEITPEAEKYAGFQHLVLHPVGDLVTWLKEPPTKLVVIDDPQVLQGLKQRMIERFDGRLYISTSLPYFLEFASPNVTKAAGLEFVAEHLGFSRERTVAFGDGENDIELVDWAGYGVAVGNANADVKERADFVCPSVDDEGVAQVLEAYLDSRA